MRCGKTGGRAAEKRPRRSCQENNWRNSGKEHLKKVSSLKRTVTGPNWSMNSNICSSLGSKPTVSPSSRVLLVGGRELARSNPCCTVWPCTSLNRCISLPLAEFWGVWDWSNICLKSKNMLFIYICFICIYVSILGSVCLCLHLFGWY